MEETKASVSRKVSAWGNKRILVVIKLQAGKCRKIRGGEST